ncbi:UNVERIFIED_CONTAM: hypothetical protein GTU68_030444 [Idotea baltica]|nr:hypothetical protein [Idotea baltica]
MCGIVGYLGNQKAFPILLEGLKRLEYRGYDSSGISLLGEDLNTFKKKGKVSELEKFEDAIQSQATIGIGHTRWATHGKPDDVNAHPHHSGNNRLALVHNGIIENYTTLKEYLISQGHEFKSETDTEVLVHLIEEIQEKGGLDLESAVRHTLKKVIGAFAIAVIDKEQPDIIIGARKSSPLVVGVGKDEFFIASDATPIIKYTNQIIYLEDDEIVTIQRGKEIKIKSSENELVDFTIEQVDLKLEEIEKSGYDHFMLKEIYQQDESIFEAMRGRINASEGWVKVGGMHEHYNRIGGTSWHAGLIAEYLFEELARIPVEVEYASEFRYRNPIIGPKDVVIALSQSGETADTLSALELAKDKGALIYGVVNNVGSSIARFTDCGSYIHAGPEIGVASTKAFTSQLVVLTLMALDLAHKRGTISESEFQKLISEFELIPKKVKSVLSQAENIKNIASEIKSASNALYLGRGYNFPIALEGALKLKEISYIHAEGYPAAEMKHGPIALIDMYMPVIVIATNMNAYEKIFSNVQEVKARKGIVIAIVSEGDTEIKKIADFTIEIPHTEDIFSPLLSSIPLQLLAYYIAVMRGCNVDQPRNLAKSVTVE